ncbi:MAG: nitrilase-related carbon-nitrogen hydrolase [Bacteroidota bacterium]
MIIKLFQYDPVWEDKAANKEIIWKILSEQNKISAETVSTELGNEKLLVFPEMTLTGFSMKAAPMSETLGESTFGFFSSVAQSTGCHILAGMVENDDGRLHNTLMHIDNTGKLLNKYRKIHPFSVSGEDRYFSAGSLPVITEIAGMKAGLSICYDLRFPELFRYYAKERVDIIINIANWPVQRIEHWKTLSRARAIENQCYFAGINRTGTDAYGHHYNGCSVLIDPLGHDVIPFSNEQNCILEAEVNKEEVARVREKLPFLSDMRLI